MPAGTIVSSGSLVSPGGQQGIPGPNAVSSDAGNITTWGTDGRLYVPDPASEITSIRLRSFNAAGNSTFECDQKLCGASSATNGAGIDRWAVWTGGTMAVTRGQVVLAAGPLVASGIQGAPSGWPNVGITRNALRITLTTQQASLGATDLLQILQVVEGPSWRELAKDVHSLALVVNSSVANLKFSISLVSPDNSWSLVKLCTLGATGFTYIPLPNIPVWAAGGNWSMAPGALAYNLRINLAVGSTYIAPAADTWQSGQFHGAPGMSNFAASPVNSIFDVAFVQHEPGPFCTTLIDKPFSQNYDECLRYYQKTYPYATAVGTATSLGTKTWPVTVASLTLGVGPVTFLKSMAKAPTVTMYNHSTGTANSIQDSSAVNHSSAAAGNIGDSGFNNVGFATAMAGAGYIIGHYICDTGW